MGVGVVVVGVLLWFVCTCNVPVYPPLSQVRIISSGLEISYLIDQFCTYQVLVYQPRPHLRKGESKTSYLLSPLGWG